MARPSHPRPRRASRLVATSIAIVVAVVTAACEDDGPQLPDSNLPTRASTATSTTQRSTVPPGSPEATPLPTDQPSTPSTDTSTGDTGGTTSPRPSPTGSTATLGEPEVTFTHLGEQREDLLDLVPAPRDRLYQIYQSGTIELTNADATEGVVALDISERTEASGEQGLLGLAIAPDGQHAYVNYTDSDADGMTVIAEYTIASDGTFVAASARTVLTIDQPYANHNGGDMEFGPDGYLYIGTGDGGSANDPERRALDLSSLLGKILRIDPRGAGDGGDGGVGDIVPPDNPFVDDPGNPDARGEVWSYGLRNPWRFTFDEPTGALWITDVGQSAVEEVNVMRADPSGLDAGRGTNLGWSAFEGEEVVNDDQRSLAENHQPPLYTYGHDDGRCSVSGAASYHGDAIPGLAGGFVFGDYCSGEIWAVPVDGSSGVVELGEVPDPSAVRLVHGVLYVTSLTEGLFRIDPA